VPTLRELRLHGMAIKLALAMIGLKQASTSTSPAQSKEVSGELETFSRKIDEFLDLKLEAAIERIEQDIREIKAEMRDVRLDITGIRTADFRLIYGAILAVALGLAGIMAHAFHWL
jgi:hypothetical protein